VVTLCRGKKGENDGKKENPKKAEGKKEVVQEITQQGEKGGNRQRLELSTGTGVQNYVREMG